MAAVGVDKKMKGRRKTIIACIGALVAIQLATYFVLASARIPIMALQLTPDRTHFKGKAFSWVLLDVSRCENLTDSQKSDLLSLFGSRYGRVYFNESELPRGAQDLDSAGRWVGYNDGFSFNFSIISRGPFWVYFSHRDRVGNVAGSFGKHFCIWLFGGWLGCVSRGYVS